MDSPFGLLINELERRPIRTLIIVVSVTSFALLVAYLAATIVIRSLALLALLAFAGWYFKLISRSESDGH